MPCSAAEKKKKILASEIYKEVLKLNNKKIIQFFKWAKDQNRHLTREDTQMANNHEQMLQIISRQEIAS